MLVAARRTLLRSAAATRPAALAAVATTVSVGEGAVGGAGRALLSTVASAQAQAEEKRRAERWRERLAAAGTDSRAAYRESLIARSARLQTEQEEHGEQRMREMPIEFLERAVEEEENPAVGGVWHGALKEERDAFSSSGGAVGPALREYIRGELVAQGRLDDIEELLLFAQGNGHQEGTRFLASVLAVAYADAGYLQRAKEKLQVLTTLGVELEDGFEITRTLP